MIRRRPLKPCTKVRRRGYIAIGRTKYLCTVCPDSALDEGGEPSSHSRDGSSRELEAANDGETFIPDHS